MSIKTSLWKVGQKPTPLKETILDSEKTLEDMIVSAPQLLSEDWMLIGRQERTFNSNPLDLLAIAPDSSLVVIELKRDKTPRDVVSQALDYASWVQTLDTTKILDIYKKFSNGGDLAVDFEKRFGSTLQDDEINSSHQIIIVAAELDLATERIVNYLKDRAVPINVLFFQVFESAQEKIISRTWLIDPAETQSASLQSNSKVTEPWNGEFYCSFGDGEERSWDEARHYGFICGGGGEWYSRTLHLLAPGDRIWAKVPGTGFVGVGRVSGIAQPASEFLLLHDGQERPALEVLKKANYHKQFKDDLTKCEYFVAIDWLDTVEKVGQAVQEVGMFGNQNTICRPSALKWRSTVDRLKLKFPHFDDVANQG